MITQVVLTKAQILAALQSAALAQAGISPSTPGLTVTVQIIEELQIPQVTSYPMASVLISTP